MADTHAAVRPRFRLRWLFGRRGSADCDDAHPGHGNVPKPFTDDDWVPRGNRMLYDRVKHGLAAALQATDRSGTVLVPAYLPGGVTWAVRTAGFDVRYYPVNGDLSLPTAAVAERIDEVEPAALLFIHYFGFVDEGFDELAAIARERDAFIIEDCARGVFGRDRDGRLLGSTGDLALFCLHKTLPVPNGGLVIARHAGVPPPESQRSERLTIPRVAVHSIARRAGIGLNATPTIIRETGADIGPIEPDAQGRAPGSLTYRGLRRTDPEAVRSTRHDRYRTLRRLLVTDSSLEVVTPEAPDGCSPYGVAALADSAESRQRLVRSLRSNGLPCQAFTWPAVYRHAESRSSSGAETLRNRLIVCPTHQGLATGTVERMAAVVAADREP